MSESDGPGTRPHGEQPRQPGEQPRQAGEQPRQAGEHPRRLDRAPGERFRMAPGGPSSGDASAAASGPTPSAAVARSASRGIMAAAGVAVVIVIGRALLGQVNLGIGMWAVAAFAGWLIALALIWGSGGRPIPNRAVIAVVLAVAAIAGGVLLEWLLARVGGGALGPIDYVNERYGVVAYVELVVAGVVAGLRAR